MNRAADRWVSIGTKEKETKESASDNIKDTTLDPVQRSVWHYSSTFDVSDSLTASLAIAGVIVVLPDPSDPPALLIRRLRFLSFS